MVHRTRRARHQTQVTQAIRFPPKAGLVSQMAEELALVLGCPVEVSYLKHTREVLVVARPKPGREVRVTLPAPPVGLIENPYAALKYDLLKALRYALSCDPPDHPPIS